MKVCSVNGCGKKMIAKTYCDNHYRKFKAYGDPLAGRVNSRKSGEGCIVGVGYLIHRINGKGIRAHRKIVEDILGKKLPNGAVVHHVDHDRLNNSPSNLVVCPNAAYHNLLHIRERALKASGNPNYRKCNYCKKWDDPKNLTIGTSNAYHRLCNNAGIYYKEQK